MASRSPRSAAPTTPVFTPPADIGPDSSLVRGPDSDHNPDHAPDLAPSLAPASDTPRDPPIVDPPRLLACERAALAAAEAIFEAETLLGPPPLIDGEDEDAYDALMARISNDVGPTDMIETFWVRDVVDLVWQIRGLRRMRASLITSTAHEGVEKTLNAFLDWLPAHELARRWAARDEAAVTQVDRIVAAAGLTREAITTQTFAARINEIDRIDRMTASAMLRRDAVLRQVERHRAVTADRLRRASEAAAAFMAQTRGAGKRDAA